MHESWPVLVQTEPTFETATGSADQMTMRMFERIAWLTRREYVDRFGTEPPTAPLLAILAAVYADHPDYREEWRP